MTLSVKTIELQEYRSRRLPKSEIRREDAVQLANLYRKQVSLVPPSFMNDDQWELCSQGYVGSIRVSQELSLVIAPKVGVGNLFRMLEYAHDLARFEREGLTETSSLDDFFESLAAILAERVLDRARRGFYRTYLETDDALPYVRGTIDVGEVFQRPCRIRLPCHFEEHTADVEENQILSFTLQRIARSSSLTPRIRPRVSRAYRSLAGLAPPRRFSPTSCVGRLYHRLNEDYRALHALCRFFLENCGPMHARGDRGMVPFLVDMSLLFERFVAKWLKANLPDHLRLRTQERVEVGADTGINFHIDMVLYDRRTGVPLAVLDTKYKAHEKSKPDDVQQILSYAAVKGCRHGFLIYPSDKTAEMEAMVESGYHIGTMRLPLAGDVEEAGRLFRDELLSKLGALHRPALEERARTRLS